VGDAGHVTCLDISGDMLAFAEERARTANVVFIEADIDTTELEPDSYDVVLSRAAVMYTSDPLETLRHLRRLLRPGGRLAVAVWATPDNVAFATPVPVMVEMLGIEPPAGRPGPFALGEPGALENLVRQAGFTEVADGTTLAVYELPDSEACTQWVRDVAPPITELIAEQPAYVQNEVWDRVTDAWEPFQGQDGHVRLPCTAVWASGTNPTRL
jgi:SAM-dependent methyltransferase